jgi:hypothetical protein
MLNGFYLFHKGKASDYIIRILCAFIAILDLCVSVLNKLNYRLKRRTVRTRRSKFL